MKKILLTLIFLSFICILLFNLYSQEASKKSDSSLTANSQLTEVRLSGFEDASFWLVYMPIDQGVIVKQAKVGSPVDGSDDKATNAISNMDELYGIPKI